MNLTQAKGIKSIPENPRTTRFITYKEGTISITRNINRQLLKEKCRRFMYPIIEGSLFLSFWVDIC